MTKRVERLRSVLREMRKLKLSRALPQNGSDKLAQPGLVDAPWRTIIRVATAPMARDLSSELLWRKGHYWRRSTPGARMMLATLCCPWQLLVGFTGPRVHWQ
jgi:hypothetical protein